jgi:hypothetical protein
MLSFKRRKKEKKGEGRERERKGKGGVKEGREETHILE